MILFVAMLAFALLMGVNLYILLYQVRVVELLAYLRSNFPPVYERMKRRLFFTVVMSDQQTRAALQRANDNMRIEDRMVEETLQELTALRQRGFWIFVPMTALLVGLVILAFW